MSDSNARCRVTFGCYEVQGKRPSMEDKHFARLNCESIGGCYEHLDVFGVYDGHGGSIVSVELERDLHNRLINKLVKGDEQNGIHQAFDEMDKYLIEKSMSEGSWPDGSTAVVAIVADDVLYVANVGDSEAVFVKKQEDEKIVSILATTAHTASDSLEQRRIREMGGKIFFGRVFGSLAVSRSFGDIHYKPYVNAEPSVFRLELDETCKYLIMACDGLWDVCKYEEAAEMVHTWVSEQGKNLTESASLLVDYALSNESNDNVTVLIVQFHWGEDAVMATENANASAASNAVEKTRLVENARERPSFKVRDDQKLPQKENENLSVVQKENENLSVVSMVKSVGAGSDVDAPIFLKSLVGETICRSYFYLNASQHYFCATRLGTLFPLPCWVSLRLISLKLFGESGVKSLELTEEFHKSFFVWGTEFSNVHTTFSFEEPPICIGGVVYPSSEHYFQSQKPIGTPNAETIKKIMENATPDQAYGIGNSCTLRSDWETVKDSIMFAALEAKFTQHEALKQLLLETEGKLLVQLKPKDPYWGTGPDGRGKNKHGEILTSVRDAIIRKSGD